MFTNVQQNYKKIYTETSLVCKPVIPTLWRLRQKGYNFENSLVYMTKSSLENNR